MPVRSLTSSVLRWPAAAEVDRALRAWAERAAAANGDVRLIGYFGSYARGDWGVGSDVDVIIVVADSEEPFARRGARWDLTDLPVPADVLVYTATEWASRPPGRRFSQMIDREAVWVYRR